ncbi:MAG: hypothetical protein H6741_21510 [Alphaproteobacteria bacterium]|nr:hypothetical protein [Alphaproteobacteria bacterium]
MRAWTLMAMATLSLAGCQEGFQGFNEGGNSNDPEIWGDDTGRGNDDNNRDAPEIVDLIVYFDDYPSFGDVLVIEAVYQDRQDDLLNGLMRVAITTGSSGNTTDLEFGINNTDARIEDGAVIVVLQQVDTSEDYTVDVELMDAAGNSSEVVSAST